MSDNSSDNDKQGEHREQSDKWAKQRLKDELKKFRLKKGQSTTEISISRYIELLMAEETLARLEAGGVDNWSYYSDALRGTDFGEECPRLQEYEDSLWLEEMQNYKERSSQD